VKDKTKKKDKGKLIYSLSRDIQVEIMGCRKRCPSAQWPLAQN